jgi:hypothetical protein
MKVWNEKKLLVTIMGLLSPITSFGVALDVIPKWLLLATACINGAAAARLNLLLRPGADNIEEIITPNTNPKLKEKE